LLHKAGRAPLSPAASATHTEAILRSMTYIRLMRNLCDAGWDDDSMVEYDADMEMD
jgi:hypothetical protein